MFTGLVQAVGRVTEVRKGRGSARLGFDSGWTEVELQLGESIAVDGVCLSVIQQRRGRFEVEAVEETLQRTTLGSLRSGQPVNLERSLQIGDRLGGHLVQGHVDGTGRLLDRSSRGDDHRMRIELKPELSRYVAFKGSIAVSGVSLTVSKLEPQAFEVALIPQTLAATTLGGLRVGDPVNLEVDLLSRYLERLIHQRTAPETG